MRVEIEKVIVAWILYFDFSFYTGCPKKKFVLGNQHNFQTNGHSEVCEESVSEHI